MRVFLDDERPTPEGWTRVAWPDEAIALLQAGQVEEISLDHDLGDDARGTGYDVVRWIEEAVALEGFRPPRITVHSANAAARVTMEAGVRSIVPLSAANATRTVPSLVDEGLLRIVPGFVPDSATLYEALVSGVVWDARIRARRVASFGVPYNYAGTVWPEVAMPPALASVAAAVAAVVGYAPNNCLANYYPDGDSTMGYHADSVAELEAGTGVSIVSLGATRTLSFRWENDRAVTQSFALEAGSLLHMTAALQASWRHAVLRAPEAVGGRISLTFRRLRRVHEPAG